MQCTAAQLRPCRLAPRQQAFARPRGAPARSAEGPRNPAVTQEAMERMAADPNMAARLKALQETMARPDVQAQMAQMQAVMSNSQLQARMAALRDDPEFAGFFKDIQAGGMQALMKYYNDPEFLSKLNAKVGDAAAAALASTGAATPPATAAPATAPATPEITTLLEAARYGDLEAVEDFLAVGKDVGMTDSQGRTPLHFAAGYAHEEIARALLEEGAPLEAADSMGNTPLHYAAGYGRAALVRLLLAAGADRSAKNGNGSIPYDVGTADSRNPVSQDTDLLAQLKP